LGDGSVRRLRRGLPPSAERSKFAQAGVGPLLLSDWILVFLRGELHMATQGPDLSGSDVMYPPLSDGNGSADGHSASRALVAAGPAYAPMAPSFGGFGARGPEIVHGGFNQTWLVNCLRRRWLLASLMGLLFGAIAAGLLMWLFPESSRITAYLQVKGD